MSTVRLAEILKIDMNDFPYSGGIALMFSALEPCLLVTAACIPLLRPLVSRKKSTDEGNSYATGNTRDRNEASSTPWAEGFSELPDDDGSTRQLHMGQSKYGAEATVAVDGGSLDSSYAADNHHTNMELKTITVKRDWRVEESAA